MGARYFPRSPEHPSAQTSRRIQKVEPLILDPNSPRGVYYRTLRRIYFLDPPRGLGGVADPGLHLVPEPRRRLADAAPELGAGAACWLGLGAARETPVKVPSSLLKGPLKLHLR